MVILKDGMQHVGKLMCSKLGLICYMALALVWKFFPHYVHNCFLKWLDLEILKRATILAIYSSFAKDGNLSDLYAKGEAISTVFNVLGLDVRIQLVSTTIKISSHANLTTMEDLVYPRKMIKEAGNDHY
uniref:Protein root UVB sensitive/RUS domain-containing protein n=1 Tax=Lactuca sativa TaxID=4236 RepID=A0A9R1XXV0_LACSA|nr:hypothetical protein LSAT_V11C100041090 [Lactuca sativa]